MLAIALPAIYIFPVLGFLLISDNQENNMRVSLLLGIVVSAICASSAFAQLTFGPPTTVNGGNTTGPVFFGGPTATAVGGAGSESLNLKLDWNWQQTAGGMADYTNNIAQISFTVGPLPVLIDNLNFEENAKWVNGGGTAGSPITTWATQATIYQNGGNSNTILSTDFLKGTQTGNGYTVVDDGAGAGGGYVLANGVTYTLQVYVNTSVDPSGLSQFDPTSVVTLEAGSISTWPGFTGSFDWQTVPEPTGLCLMAPMSLWLLKRRRV